jgi:lipoprotein-releasing system permease protein
VILSAMNGLEAESRSRLLSLSEHITLRADGPGADFESLSRAALAVDGVKSVAPFVRLESMLASDFDLRPAIVRGIDPDVARENSDLTDVVGRDLLSALVEGTNRILLGRFVASNLRVQTGDRIRLWQVEIEGSRINPKQTVFTVAGVFDAGVEAHDANLALTHFADAGRLVGLDGKPEALAIRLDDPMQVERVDRALKASLGEELIWSNWAEENKSLFQAMAIEKTMMTIVLMFIAGIAAFNIVASLMMVVNEKEKDIAILRTMGLTPKKLVRVFLIQGAVIGVGGTLAGVIVGLALAANLETILPWLEQTIGFQIMPGDVYYVTQVPSEIQLTDVLLIPGFAVAITLLATVYPSRRAARIEPAEVLRYE